MPSLPYSGLLSATCRRVTLSLGAIGRAPPIFSLSVYIYQCRFIGRGSASRSLVFPSCSRSATRLPAPFASSLTIVAAIQRLFFHGFHHHHHRRGRHHRHHHHHHVCSAPEVRVARDLPRSATAGSCVYVTSAADHLVALAERCLPPRSSVSPRSSSRPSRSVKRARSSLTGGSDQRLVLDDSLDHPPSPLLSSHSSSGAPSTCSFSHFLHFRTSLLVVRPQCFV